MGIVKDVLYTFSSHIFLELFKKQNVFPCYHLSCDTELNHLKYLYSYKNVSNIEKDIDLLTDNYKNLNIKEINQTQLKRNSFLLTFDDGLREIYTIIYPILKEKGLSAMFFVNPTFVDNQKMMYKHRLSVLLCHLGKSNFEKEVLDTISQICDFKYSNQQDFIQKFIALKFIREKDIDKVFELLKIDEEQYLRKNKLYITKDEIQEMMNDGFYFGEHTMTHKPLGELTHEEQKKEILDSVQ